MESPSERITETSASAKKNEPLFEGILILGFLLRRQKEANHFGVSKKRRAPQIRNPGGTVPNEPRRGEASDPPYRRQILNYVAKARKPRRLEGFLKIWSSTLVWTNQQSLCEQTLRCSI